MRRFASRRPAAAPFARAPLALAALLALAGLASTPRTVLAQEEAPEPLPPPLVTRFYDVAWDVEQDTSSESLFSCDPESGLRSGPTRFAWSLWEDGDALGAALIFDDPSPRPALCGGYDKLKELVEQHACDEDYPGAVEYLFGALYVKRTESSHARVARYLAELEAAFTRRAAVAVRLIALSSLDPALLSPDPDVLAEAAGARGRVLCAQSRTLGDLSWSARIQASVRRATVIGLRPNRSGSPAFAEPYAASLPSGIEVEVGVFHSTVPGRLCARVGVGDVTIDALGTRRILGADVDFPTRGERSAGTIVEVADAGRAAIVIGPRGASETAVLVVEASAAPALPREPAAQSDGRPHAFLNADAVLYSTTSRHRVISPDVLIDILKGATGGDESWGDGTSIEAYRGRILMTNTPAVISQSAAIIRGLSERARPRRCDAWLLEARSLPSLETGPLDATVAEALLARVAKRDGVTLAARFGGGLAAHGALFARSRTESRFLGGVDTISLGTPSATATLRVPITAAVDAGVAFEARLERAGLDAASGAASRLFLEAKVTLQTVDMSRTARVPLEGGEVIDVALPVVAREEVAGRVELPSSGGWALVVSEGAADDPARPHRLLLLHVGP